MLRDELIQWVDKVVLTHENKNYGCVNTVRMLNDVDEIISRAFDHDPVLYVENPNHPDE